jgi:hypothetical protein
MRESHAKKVSVGFRFSRATTAILEAVSTATKVTKTQLIEDALAVYLASDKQAIPSDLRQRQEAAQCATAPSRAERVMTATRRALADRSSENQGASSSIVGEAARELARRAIAKLEDQPESGEPKPKKSRPT